MIEVTRHDDVQRIRMWTRRSIAVGYDVSAYVFDGILIDTGFRHVARELRATIDELRVRAVMVTHWHEDHAGNAPSIAESGLPIWMSVATEEKLRERPQVKFYRHFVWGRPDQLRDPMNRFEPTSLIPLHTPGHSADHHVVWDAQSGTLFGGDLWLGVRASITGYDERPRQIIESLDRIIELRPARFFDAHRGPVENPLRALSAKRDWLAATIEEIERRTRRGESEGAILRHVLGGEELTAIASQGEYSRRNFVRAVARDP